MLLLVLLACFQMGFYFVTTGWIFEIGLCENSIHFNSNSLEFNRDHETSDRTGNGAPSTCPWLHREEPECCTTSGLRRVIGARRRHRMLDLATGSSFWVGIFTYGCCGEVLCVLIGQWPQSTKSADYATIV